MNSKVSVLYEILQYDSEPEILLLTWGKYRKLKKESKAKGGIICRPAKSDEVKEIQHNAFTRLYDEKIATKYSVSMDWRQNRWFVEQVKPTL